MNIYRQPIPEPVHAWQEVTPGAAIERCLNGCGVRRLHGSFPFVRGEADAGWPAPGTADRRAWTDHDPGCVAHASAGSDGGLQAADPPT